MLVIKNDIGKYILVVSMLFMLCQNLFADICTSEGDGNWTTTTTWSCGHVPGDGDTVYVLVDDTITFDSNVDQRNDVIHIDVASGGALYFNNGKLH